MNLRKKHMAYIIASWLILIHGSLKASLKLKVTIKYEVFFRFLSLIKVGFLRPPSLRQSSNLKNTLLNLNKSKYLL